MFTLSNYSRQEDEYLWLAVQFPAISVVYQKEFSNDGPLGKDYLKPLVFSIFYRTQSDIENYQLDGSNRIASFNWSDAKRILQKQPAKYATLIDAIEKGSLDFSSSELVYGLKEK